MSLSVTLQNGVRKLQDDHQNGARILALDALQILGNLLAEIPRNLVTPNEIWETLCHGAWELKRARPSMDAAIGGGLADALQAIKRTWRDHFQVDINSEPGPGSTNHTLTYEERDSLLTAADAAIRQTIDFRKQNVLSVALNFQEYIQQKIQNLNRNTVRILTLSHSTSIAICLTHLLLEIPSLHIDLRIMESRPSCEGASLARALVKEAYTNSSRARLSIQIEPDSSVAILARDIDVLLLGADRISPEGDVSNKTGSLAAAICARTISPSVEVVVVAEADKIAKSAGDELVEEGNDRKEVTRFWGLEEEWEREVSVRNVYFEWVRSRWIDVYICERGRLGKDDVRRIVADVIVRDKEIFGRFETEADRQS